MNDNVKVLMNAVTSNVKTSMSTAYTAGYNKGIDDLLKFIIDYSDDNTNMIDESSIEKFVEYLQKNTEDKANQLKMSNEIDSRFESSLQTLSDDVRNDLLSSIDEG